MKRRLCILSIEDNDGDRFMIERFFDPLLHRFELFFVGDGCEAMDFLGKTGQDSQTPKPHAILLDLNLQKKDGREVLEEIKKAPQFKDIPVFVLTTSRADEDRQRCLSLGAERFFSKPASIQTFNDVLDEIRKWIENRYSTPEDNTNLISFVT